MSVIDIPATEQGVIRVFAISRPIATMARALKQAPKTDIAADLLEYPVTEKDIELFALSDLTGVGLPRYLSEGYDIDRQALRRDHARLDALDGYVLLVFSAIGGPQPVRLKPAADLTLIGTYSEPRRNHAAAPVAAEAAKPYTGPGSEPAAPTRYRVGGAIGGFAVFLVLFLIWWIVK